MIDDPITIPSPQFVTKPWRWNGTHSLVIGRPPLNGNLLSLLPQQRCTFATALQEGYVAHWWRASAAAAPRTVVPPPCAPLLRILYSLLWCCQTAAIVPPLVLSLLTHLHCSLLPFVSVVLCHILPYSLVCRHGFGIVPPSQRPTMLFQCHTVAALPPLSVWCKPTWVKNSWNVTFYEFLGCQIYKYLRWLLVNDKPIGPLPRRDYAVKRMVLVQIEYNLVLTLSWCRDLSKKGGNAPRATD